MRTLIFGCLVCGLLAACESSNYGSEHQEETPMFSLFKKKHPTTVNPLLQAQLQRVESFPTTAPVPSSGSTCTKYAVRGTPPEVVLSGKEDDILDAESSIGFVTSDRPDRAVLLMNVLGNGSMGTHIEAWQLSSAPELRLTRKIPMQISPDDATWTTRIVEEAACLPNGRVLFIIGGYSKSGARTDSFVYNIEQQRFSPFFADIQLAMSRYLESQRLNADATVVRYLSDVNREGPELYYNYYHRFQLFTRAHPDGIEVLTLGIDIGNAKRWAVVDKKLYLHTHDPRTPSNPRDAYWSLDLSSLLAD